MPDDARFIKFRSGTRNVLAVEETYPATDLRLTPGDDSIVIWMTAYSVEIVGNARFELAGKTFELQGGVLAYFDEGGETRVGPSETVFVYQDGSISISPPMK